MFMFFKLLNFNCSKCGNTPWVAVVSFSGSRHLRLEEDHSDDPGHTDGCEYWEDSESGLSCDGHLPTEGEVHVEVPEQQAEKQNNSVFNSTQK